MENDKIDIKTYPSAKCVTRGLFYYNRCFRVKPAHSDTEKMLHTANSRSIA